MKKYVVLLRGINVGGKNKLPMADLRPVLEAAGFQEVSTYIQSGNIILQGDMTALAVADTIEKLLIKNFKLDSAIIRTLAIEESKYDAIIAAAPKHFGRQPQKYRHDILFLIEGTAAAAMKVIELRPGVDQVWPGKGVIYFQRPAIGQPDAAKTKLGKLFGTPLYKVLTIRNWRTSQKLSELLAASH